MKGIKVVLIGDSQVGKSAIFRQFESGTFTEESTATIGGAFTKIIATSTDRRTVPMDLWDTAGQEQYKSVIPLYFENARVILLVYDITRSATFDHLPDWLHVCAGKVRPNAKFIVVGNKCDLNENRRCTPEGGIAYAESIGAIFCLETSAKTAEGLDSLLQGIADEAIRNRWDSEASDQPPLNPTEPPRTAGCC
jgi:small GTP-binding protein